MIYKYSDEMDSICNKLKEADKNMTESLKDVKNKIIGEIENQEKFSGKTAIVIYDFIKLCSQYHKEINKCIVGFDKEIRKTNEIIDDFEDNSIIKEWKEI